MADRKKSGKTNKNTENKPPVIPEEDRILRTEFSEEMSRSYLDYAMSVIVARAIPDVRDGLKPVQRRTLYAMHELGVRHDRPHRKSARIVGDTMGKYHPHGDSSIYEALVVMAQDWKKGEILVDGHGNFGSIEGDGAAAARYTEARLTELTESAFLADLDKDVVDYTPNFDETEKEPTVLPVKIPNILVNGADGIAVGMKTSIPTHNLRETIAAMKLLMKQPTISTEELMTVIPGPDFPTGGIITNQNELLSIYETGTGRLRLRGKLEFEKAAKRSERDKLVVTEIPYTMIGAGIAKFISDVAALMEAKKLPEVVDISNQSSKEGIRIVFELKSGADVDRVKNLLYKKTGLEDTFGVNMLAVVEGTPRTVGLKAILYECVQFQIELNTRNYNNLLRKEREKAEVQEGLITAIDVIDTIIEIIRGSKNIKIARAALMGDCSEVKFKTKAAQRIAKTLAFTERQANAILEMRLSKLIGLEILQLTEEHEETLRKIGQYERILSSPRVMTNTIIKELDACAEKFGRDRRTVIEETEAAQEVKEEVVEQELVFALDRFGYAKSFDPQVYARNEEGIKSENVHIFPVMNTGKIYIFTDTGRLHQVKMSDVPACRAKDKGQPLDNFSNFESRKERIVGIFPESIVEKEKFVFVTAAGMVKIVEGAEFVSGRKTVAATKLNEGDAVVSVLALTDSQLVLMTEDGYALRFAVSEISEMKKTSVGVKGMQLQAKDHVKNAWLVSPRAKKEDGTPQDGPDWSSVKLLKRGAKGTKIRKKSGT